MAATANQTKPAVSKSETVKVMFRRGYTVQAADGETYEKGKTYELSPESAQHFTRRGLAGDPKDVAKELKDAEKTDAGE